MQRKTKCNLLSHILCMMLIVAMALCAVGCNKADEKVSDGQMTVTEQPESGKDAVSGDEASGEEDADPAGNAASDVTEIGEGKVSFDFSVVDKDGNETKFVIHTDKEIVGDALLEQALIEGEEGAYGLYVKKVNGITADYDVDQTYWAFYINGEYAMTGVDMTPIAKDESYQFKVEK